MKQRTKEWLYILGYILIFLTWIVDVNEHIRMWTPILLFGVVLIVRFVIPTKEQDATRE